MTTFYQLTRPDDPKTKITLKGCAFCGSEPIFSVKRGQYRLCCVRRFSGCPMNARTHSTESIDETILRWEMRLGPISEQKMLEIQDDVNTCFKLAHKIPLEIPLSGGKFELKCSSNGKFYFNLKARNGQIILSSEMYESRSAAENGIASVQRNAGDDQRYNRWAAPNGELYFELKAANGQVVGKSEMYMSDSARENGIESVKKNAVSAMTIFE